MKVKNHVGYIAKNFGDYTFQTLALSRFDTLR